jgi:hypothetical protein
MKPINLLPKSSKLISLIVMPKRKQQEIIFNHIKLDEPVSPEFVKELHQLVAKWLFEAWLKWKESGGQATCDAPTKPLTDDEFRDIVMKVVASRLSSPPSDKNSK